MTAPSLFDAPPRAPLINATGGNPEAAPPRARASDPTTAHQAAKRMEKGNSPLMVAIRAAVMYRPPASAFDIAERVESLTHRWQNDTIRSAVSRAPFLRHVDNLGRTDSGSPCRRYVLKDMP